MSTEKDLEGVARIVAPLASALVGLLFRSAGSDQCSRVVAERLAEEARRLEEKKFAKEPKP
jgi:hypothetical protein